MKTIIFAILSAYLMSTILVEAKDASVPSSQPDLSILTSIDHIQKFIAGKTKQDYSKMKLTRISSEYCNGVPRKGAAYVYYFNSTTLGIMSALCIYHFADGVIIETATGG
ncbi:MAG: hypothetical protein K8R57_06560 [Verrucomicrobia bacterium]|nr:hypothetical protein [Verrucomicrobiota bacterium]